uniref:Sodium/calcium exchanger membrane region domain-containing protein n=2 Tax=Caenorhabditis japonica TaxID=281687 RepID=A0A8R1DH16_CAEJA
MGTLKPAILFLSLFLLICEVKGQQQPFVDYFNSELPDHNVSIYDGMPFDEEMCSAEECLINKTWTSDEKCAYIKCNRDSCEGGGYLLWSQYIKCQYNIAARVVFIILGIIYLIILFVIMSSIADDFFCPAISGIVSHLRMSESIAGVTFLAFGNGAPDVFSSISSVLTTPKPKADLALGDLFGTSIFVTTVVLAIIILTKSFRVAIIPTLRDLLFYMVTLAFIVFCFLKYDKIEVWMPATFLGIYGVYVVTVIVFGIYRTQRKKRVLKKKMKQEGSDIDVSRPSSSASDLPIYGAMRLKQHPISISALFHFMVGYSQFLKNLARAQRREQKRREIGGSQGYTNQAFEEDVEASTFKKVDGKIANFCEQNSFETDMSCVDMFSDEEEVEVEDSGDEGREEEFAYAHGTVFTSHDQVSLAATEIEHVEITTWRSSAWVWDLLNHLKSWPSREEFREMNIFSKILAVIKIIPVFFFKMTVPSNEMSWCKSLFILHCFASIQFALFAIQIINKKPFSGSPGLWLYGLGFSAILAAIGMYFLPLRKEQKYYKETYSYLGFLMSIAWIYATSNEIVGVITMIGVVTGLSMELLGLTIMAWSNCIGDIVADIAVVKQGFPKMAMAAAIGGPLFNLLIGFGLPFTIAAAQGKEIELQINPVYRLLMLYLGISLVTTFVALFVQRFTVRWPHAAVLIFIFITFLIFICLAEFNVLEWK